MKSFFILFVLVLQLTTPVFGEDDGGYTMDELETLVLKKAWTQVIIMLPNVLPADRTGKYETIVEKAAIGHLKELAKTDPVEAWNEADDLVNKFPSLSRSKLFEEEKYQVVFLGFDGCLSDNKQFASCEKAITQFVKGERNAMELAFRAGRLLNRRGYAEAAVPFFSMAINTVTRHLYCSSEEVAMAVQSGLISGDKKKKEMAREIVASQCWNEIAPVLVKALERQPASLLRKEACELLRKKSGQPPSLSHPCH